MEFKPAASNYGDLSVEEIESKALSGCRWTPVSSLTNNLNNETVLIRGRVHTSRLVGKNRLFIIVRQETRCTVQCVLSVTPEVVSKQMLMYAAGISKESYVDIHGIVTIPPAPITGVSQEVEIQVREIYCVSTAGNLPITVEDCARSEAEIEKALQNGKQLPTVTQDNRLKYRTIDLRTPANQGIFRLRSRMKKFFRSFLEKEGFEEVDTPKIIAGSSEGGAAVFHLEYKNNKPACLAQSPQLHKQMLINADFERVFELGPVFRAEDSYTHRHLCEFTGLDVEMRINGHYSEIMDVVDRLFVNIFDEVNESCTDELKAIGKQYPFTPLKYLPKTLRLTFEEGVQMLKDAGVEVDPFGDLNTETERTLGKLVLEKYNTEFYILHRFPLAARPFYTMPCTDNKLYSNSFDVFIRGEEVISGAQRVHLAELLESRAQQCGIDVKTLSTYIDSFRYGAPTHGGFGAGLERVVMLFCGLDNIRKTSLFPRDPRRLEP